MKSLARVGNSSKQVVDVNEVFVYIAYSSISYSTLLTYLILLVIRRIYETMQEGGVSEYYYYC